MFITGDDMERLDRIFYLAMFDTNFHDRLLIDRDEHLLAEFQVTEPVRRWLCQISASTLSELAGHIVATKNIHP